MQPSLPRWIHSHQYLLVARSSVYLDIWPMKAVPPMWLKSSKAALDWLSSHTQMRLGACNLYRKYVPSIPCNFNFVPMIYFIFQNDGNDMIYLLNLLLFLVSLILFFILHWSFFLSLIFFVIKFLFFHRHFPFSLIHIFISFLNFQVFSVLFFFMLFVLGIGSNIAMCSFFVTLSNQ